MKIHNFDQFVNESISTKDRAMIVVHLKKDGILFNQDYTLSGSTFMAKDIETAQSIADSVAGTFQCTIYDDRITTDGKVPMMIVNGSQGTQQKLDLK